MENMVKNIKAAKQAVLRLYEQRGFYYQHEIIEAFGVPMYEDLEILMMAIKELADEGILEKGTKDGLEFYRKK